MIDAQLGVETALKRFERYNPKDRILALDRLLVVLEELGNPHLDLPPVIHVAGTNGKGSTVAFIRAMAEAAGLAVHTSTSPHLVLAARSCFLTPRNMNSWGDYARLSAI